jgi:hypothetical protein
MIGPKNHFYGKTHKEETKNKIRNKKLISEEEYNKRISLREKEYEVISLYSEYYSRQNQYLYVRCKKCSFEMTKTLQAFERGSLCTKCHPFTSSQAELEIIDFIESCEKKVIKNDRKTIAPLELDILIPENNLAIEYNGLFWHSDFNDYPRDRHRTKTKKCNDQNINLLHIFSDEWLTKKDLVQSMIKNRLGIFEIVGARKCIFKKISSKESERFFNENHISGFVNGCWHGALFYNDEIVLAMSLRKPRQKKYAGSVEIARLATKKNFKVSGGASKILKYVKKEIRDQYDSIISYCDLSYGNGRVYEKIGFELISEIKTNYWYTDGIFRFDRFKFRANNGKSEKEVAAENKVARIYGCGNNLYFLKL